MGIGNRSGGGREDSVTAQYLATGSSFKTWGYSFRISDVMVGRIVLETCKVIWEQLVAAHMPFPPTDEQLNSTVERFWRSLYDTVAMYAILE
ncbi:uncharacterized protein [Anabrus simplex]|uniref:uncharacterized protein isoform X4 n=1 Tax=Anabrus simplex TaxID=316456 RepID=UPI0034DCE84C